MEASEVQVDFVRKDRIGIAEAVFCLQKNVKQIEVILEESKKNGGSILLTRLSEEKFLTLNDVCFVKNLQKFNSSKSFLKYIFLWWT